MIALLSFIGSQLQAEKEDEKHWTLYEHIMELPGFMLLTFRQRKTSSSGTGCCTSIAQFHGSHLQAKEDEQNWMLHEHCSVSWFSPSGKGRRAAAELDAARALLSFMVLTFRQRKTSSCGTGCCTSIAQFQASHLQAKED
jgi:hypothetical protein